VIELHAGDCLTVLASMPESSIDALVTDPPYGLSFLQAKWDHEVPGPAYWSAALRVAKPGAVLLAFGGTRTFHRLTCAIEDAGWNVRDCMMWLYGQGWPKAKTALKPAWEPIVLATKKGPTWLNIDGCRIFTDWSERSDAWKRSGHSAKPEAEKIAAPPGNGITCHPGGRWPANVLLSHVDGPNGCELVGTKRVKGSGTGAVKRTSGAGTQGNALGVESRPAGTEMHSYSDPDGTEEMPDWRCVDGCPVRALDEQSGPGWGQTRTTDVHGKPSTSVARGKMRETVTRQYSEPGRAGASRFFYCGKATTTERGEENDHPTVKPTDLMRYLVRLVTPPGGTVLDPFMGSGSTGLACVAEGFSFVGIDLDEHNVAIARSRLIADAPLFAAAGGLL